MLTAMLVLGLAALLTLLAFPLLLVGILIGGVAWLVLNLVLLPLRIVGWGLGLGLGLLAFMIKAVVGLFLLGALVVVMVALTAPLLPLLAVALGGWFLIRALRRPRAAAA